MKTKKDNQLGGCLVHGCDCSIHATWTKKYFRA